MNEIDYSIIIPVYYNEGSIKKTYQLINDKVISKNINLNCEIIFVDDGSKDNSLRDILDLKKSHPELIKVIKFTRNFGQLSALLAGYKHAVGKCVINMAADLQDPPVLINEMLNYHFNHKPVRNITERPCIQ